MRFYQQRDKQLHAAAGAIIGLSAIFIGWAAMGLVVLAGVGKEVYDEKRYGGFDIIDALATFLGGFVVVLCIQLIRG